MSPQPNPPQPSPHVPLPIPMVRVRDELRWEYRRILRNLRTGDPPDAAELDALGADGWELTGLFADSPFLYLYFKRVK
ncbi:MAG: hypothetical protein GEU90_19660 [Gemmatimonas sp.]|nr:hypothetical protein [Gemmatimonas sp.]